MPGKVEDFIGESLDLKELGVDPLLRPPYERETLIRKSRGLAPVLPETTVGRIVGDAARSGTNFIRGTGDAITNKRSITTGEAVDPAMDFIKDVLSLGPSAGKNALGLFGGQGSTWVKNNPTMLQIARLMEHMGERRDPIRDKTEMFRGADREWRREFSDKGSYVDFKGAAKNVLGGTLGGAFHHPEAYIQYPDLANVKVKWDPHINGASYSPSRNLMTLNPTHKVDDIRDSILHEMQHWIQEKEGFAQGTSPSLMGSAARMLQLKYNTDPATLEEIKRFMYDRSAGEREANNVIARSLLDQQGIKNVAPWTGTYVEKVQPKDQFYLKTGQEPLKEGWRLSAPHGFDVDKIAYEPDPVDNFIDLLGPEAKPKVIQEPELEPEAKPIDELDV